MATMATVDKMDTMDTKESKQTRRRERWQRIRIKTSQKIIDAANEDSGTTVESSEEFLPFNVEANTRNVARSEPSAQEMSSYAAAVAAPMADVADRTAPGVGVDQIRFRRRVESPSEEGDMTGTVEEESEQDHTSDIVPLTARNDACTPHIPAAPLVDEDTERERDEAAHQQDEDLELARQLQEEEDLLAQLQGITVPESVHALPAGNEEEVAAEATASSSSRNTYHALPAGNEEEQVVTEATASSSRNTCIMIAGCVSLILVVTAVVATVLLTTISSPAETTTEWPAPTALPTYTALPSAAPTLYPRTCFETTNELLRAVDKFMQGGSSRLKLLEQAYGLPMGTWCVSNIEDFSELFNTGRNSRAISFNEDISAWDVSKVATMYIMFRGAVSFDQDLSSWNTSSVEDISYKLGGATSLEVRHPSTGILQHGTYLRSLR
jgi:hypothetical protein